MPEDILKFKAKKTRPVLLGIFMVILISTGTWAVMEMGNAYEDQQWFYQYTAFLCFGVSGLFVFFIYQMMRTVTLTPAYLKLGVKVIPWEDITYAGRRKETVKYRVAYVIPVGSADFEELLIQYRDRAAQTNSYRLLVFKNYDRCYDMEAAVLNKFKEVTALKLKEAAGKD